MKNLKSTLSKHIVSKPDTIQFVKDRVYEEAWTITSSDPHPTDEDIHVYLHKKAFKLIIVEYVWNSQNDKTRFVLTLFLDKCRLKDPKMFINIGLNLFYTYSRFTVFIDSLNTRIIGKPYLFEFPVETINMGIFNHWLSVGPVELWQQGEIYKKEEVVQKIKMRPEVEKTSLNYQGLFFRFNASGKLDGPHFGIKTPCCNKIGDKWIVDFEKTDYWIKTMINYT